MLSDPAVVELIKQTFNILSSAIGHGVAYEVPETLRYALENNAFTFSGFKTFHALREVGLSLLTPNGDIKPFSTFLNDVKAINDRYNHNYLRAEYQQAVAASQMAVRWHEFEKDGDRYDLQYRTANDSHVREEHAILHNTTLPASDPFWDSFLPPNGWGCRCTAVQVRKGKYPTSDPELAMRRGQNCTDGAKRKIFRFNPGKTMELFPPKHPYRKAPAEAKTVIEDVARREHNRTIYERLKNDPDYTDVEFDETTGGVKATHKGHSLQDAENTETFFENMKPADLERECHNLLYQWGHSAILRNEFANKKMRKTPPSLDIEIDGKIMDIRSITQGGLFGNALMAKNKQLGNVKRKTGIVSDCVCLHFHDPDMFSEEKLLHDAQWFKCSIKEVGSTQRIKHIYVVVNGEDKLRIYDI